MAEDNDGGGGGRGGGNIDVPGVGPVKAVYVYTIVALAVGFVGYSWFARSRASSADEIGYVPELDENSGTTTPGFTIGPPAEGPDPDKLPPTTNEAWAQRVTDTLMEKFGYDGQMVARVIGKYLSRQGLTPDEADLIRTAWGQHGRPPVGDFPILSVPTPPPPPSNPPPSNPPPASPPPPPASSPYKAVHTVVSGDTLSKIASRYYGNGSSAAFMKIYWANEAVIVAEARKHGVTKNYADHIYPGTRLNIPH